MATFINKAITINIAAVGTDCLTINLVIKVIGPMGTITIIRDMVNIRVANYHIIVR